MSKNFSIFDPFCNLKRYFMLWRIWSFSWVPLVPKFIPPRFEEFNTLFQVSQKGLSLFYTLSLFRALKLTGFQNCCFLAEISTKKHVFCHKIRSRGPKRLGVCSEMFNFTKKKFSEKNFVAVSARNFCTPKNGQKTRFFVIFSPFWGIQKFLAERTTRFFS